MLLLDDFAVLNEKMLRTAYLEALYHHDEFEFERLRQSYWFSVISNVSSTKNSSVVTDYFPMEAEVPGFKRPFKHFNCWKTNSCGVGTIRIPEESC